MAIDVVECVSKVDDDESFAIKNVNAVWMKHTVVEF